MIEVFAAKKKPLEKNTIMAAKVKSEAAKWKPKASIKRPGVVSKKKSSSMKTSKNYVKKYKGQGR